MSAAIQATRLLTAHRLEQDQAKVQLHEVSAPRPMPDPQLQCALDYIAHLEEELSVLQGQLMAAERLLARKDQLLRNSLVRERALRAELIKGIC